ncbi:MAG: GGDEF domain-containing protein [Vibrio sp.]
MTFHIDGYEVYFVFQPKFKNGKKTSIEALMRVDGFANIEEFIKARNHKELDLFVIASISELLENNYDGWVSINITSCSLECEFFINECIAKLKNKKIILEMTEQYSISSLKTLNNNIRKLNDNNIYVFIDDIGKNFNQTSLLHKVKFNGVKIDKAFIKEIDVNFYHYKYLVALKTKLTAIGYENIIYEGVENSTQEKLISLFNDNPIIQGFFYSKPLMLNHVKTIPDSDEKYCFESVDTTNIEKIAYDLIVNNDNNINLELYKADLTSSIFSNDLTTLIKNIRDIIYKSTTHIENSLLMMMENSNKLFIIRNEQGVVIYENVKHKETIGFSLYQKSPNEIVKLIPDYKKCLDDDKILTRSDQDFMIQDEIFNGNSYITCRQRIKHNNNTFIMTTINSQENSLIYSKDKLTDCYTRDLFSNHIELEKSYQNCVIAYIDLNGFKAINDINGHLFGDNCLKEFISVLKFNLRNKGLNDLIVRMGGDEFVILFKTNNIHMINERMSHINQAVINHFSTKRINLSFSYGVAINESEDIKTTIEMADRNMYSNKSNHYTTVKK